MQNFVQPGDVVRVAAPRAVTSGEGVLVTNLFGVATGTAANAANVEIQTVGVFDVAKASGASTSVAVGANVHWDNTGFKATGSASSNTRIGVCVGASANTDLTVRVRLHGAW